MSASRLLREYPQSAQSGQASDGGKQAFGSFALASGVWKQASNDEKQASGFGKLAFGREKPAIVMSDAGFQTWEASSRRSEACFQNHPNTISSYFLTQKPHFYGKS